MLPYTLVLQDTPLSKSNCIKQLMDRGMYVYVYGGNKKFQSAHVHQLLDNLRRAVLYYWWLKCAIVESMTQQRLHIKWDPTFISTSESLSISSIFVH